MEESKINSYFYDKIIDIALLDFNKSPDYALKRKQFYRILPPKLKTQLLKELLNDLYLRF